MRIRVDVKSGVLRRALADLLESVGHFVDGGERRAGADFTILAEATADSPAAHGPVLYLRPGRGVPPSDDPAAALSAALKGGPPAVWRPPLDAELLLEGVGPGRATAEERPPDATSVDPVLASAPDAWMGLSGGTREVLWANDAAALRIVAPGGRRLSERGASALPSAVFEREEGREVRSLDGRPHLVLWWTDAQGRRCVSVVRMPAAPTSTGDANLETLAELGRVSATLAHEIRNPLASFAGALDLLAAESDPAERAGIVAMARQRVSQMRRMLDEALRLVRPFQGAPEAISAEEVVRSAAASTRADPAFEHLQVEIRAGPRGPAILAHPEPLRQALLNLLVNAAQAQGGKGRVVVRVDSKDDRGLIYVEDDGPGFPAGSRDRAFAPFWTTKDSGTGLGLAFVKRVAEAAGGRARIEDRSKGACVCLEFPLAAGG